MIPTEGVGDFALQWDSRLGVADLAFCDDDLVEEPGLRTAVILSLFLDAPARPDDGVPDGDRRGWWGDQFAEVRGDRLGSRLWQLRRAKKTPDIVPLAEEIAREALAWLVEDRVASRVDAAAELAAGQAGEPDLALQVDIHRPDGSQVSFRFAHVWDDVAPELCPPAEIAAEPAPPPEPTPAAGHELDADTIGLWRFDEDAAGEYTTIADASGNGRDLTADPELDICGGPAGSVSARGFGTGSIKATRAGDADAIALLTGEWTWEAWAFQRTAGSIQYLWIYAAPSGETLATNYLGSVLINADGNLRVFWERASGINVDHSQSAGTKLGTGAWTHVAVRKKFNGTNYDVSFFVGGALSQTIAGVANSEGGTDSSWRFGSNESGGGSFQGALGSIRFSSVARSDAEIAASAERADKLHEADADTWALYNHAEAPDFEDLTDHGAHLRAVGTIIRTSSLINDDGNALVLDGSTALVASGYNAAQEVYRQALLADWTIEAWIRLHLGAASAERTLMSFGFPGESLATNGTQIGRKTTERIRCYMENGAGIDSEADSATAVPADPYVRHHIAVTARVVGADKYLELYVDGAFIEEVGPLTNYEGGTSGIFRLSGDGSGAIPWYGDLDDVRFSRKRRTAAEILESYQRGA